MKSLLGMLLRTALIITITLMIACSLEELGILDQDINDHLTTEQQQ